jgi:ABC-type nitrate/sulfonate/bicarbonate transport system substrate-binding protein
MKASPVSGPGADAPVYRAGWALLLVLLLPLLAACRSSSGTAGGDQRERTEAAGQAASAAAAAPVKVVFQAGFKAQANLPFVAAYVARDNGLFAEEGLDVEIEHSSGQDAHLALLAANRVQFSTTVASTILKNVARPGLPLQAIALFGQRGDTVLVALADSGISSPRDFEGKTVGYKVFPAPEYLSLLQAAGVDRGKVKEVNVGFDPRVLTERRVDVLPVFRSNEPDTLQRLGFRLTMWDPADYGVPTLGVTYVVNSDWARDNEETVVRFLRATMRAVAWIQDHRDEAVEITMRYAPQEQREHQRFMLDVELEAAQSDLTRRHGIGWMTDQQWQALQDSLVEFDAIERPVDITKVFTTKYLAQIYKEGRLNGR